MLYSAYIGECSVANFAEWLERAISERHASLRRVAEYVGVSPATIHNWLRKGAKPSYESCLKLAAYMQVPSQFILGLAGHDLTSKALRDRLPDIKPVPGLTGVVLVPIVSEASAGGGFAAPEQYIAISPPAHSSRNLVGFTVRGDCMSPLIEHNDTVIVDLLRQWTDGKIVLARVDGDLVVKRAYRRDERVILRAHAPGHPDIVAGDIQVLGPVIQIQREVI